jgi:hypothetical protein
MITNALMLVFFFKSLSKIKKSTLLIFIYFIVTNLYNKIIILIFKALFKKYIDEFNK